MQKAIIKNRKTRFLQNKTLPHRHSANLLAITLAVTFQSAVLAAETHTPHTLIVGGGPAPRSNQVAIESNVRYITRLLPDSTRTQTLFADGDASSRTIIYTPPRPATTSSAANAIFTEVFERPRRQEQARILRERRQREAVANRQNNPSNNTPRQRPASGVPSTASGNFRAPQLTQLDGASTHEKIAEAFNSLSTTTQTPQPWFVYFTGHGSQTKENQENNYFNLWGNGRFTVQDLSQQIARLPRNQAVVLVMVQCYSGSFANVLFEGGDPKANLIERDLVGFFASTKDRLAAGCSPSINEEYYRDFTSYFFAALTGRDRLNRPFAVNADYNHDGKVGLDEAFYWSLINDNSIDVPVATSDVFLEKFVTLEEKDWLNVPYSTLQNWASPAQRAALNTLSDALELSGEHRVQAAQKLDINRLNLPTRERLAAINTQLRGLAQLNQTELTTQFPQLSDLTSENWNVDVPAVLAALQSQIDAGKWDEWQKINQSRADVEKNTVGTSIYEAKKLRFLRLVQKVVRDNTLRKSGDANVKARYLRLLKEEARTTLLPSHQS